jgi:protease I
MRKDLIFFGIIIILIIAGALIYKGLTKKEINNKEKITMPENTLEGKKVAIILAFKDFRDAEYFVPKEILEKAGATVTPVSTQKGKALGADGGDAEIDITTEELKVVDFDVVIFIGGPGALKYLDNEKSYTIIRETVSQGKVLGSICISPVILAKAGVLKDKKATVWSSVLDRSAIKILKEKGATYIPEEVVIDGKIVTGNGPDASEEFAAKLMGLLTLK